MSTRLQLEILRAQQAKAAGASQAAARATTTVSPTVSVVDVVGLQTALDAKASLDHAHAIAGVTGLQAALDAKAASGHSHDISGVTGLQAALDAKAVSGHTHDIASVTGLQAALDAKAASGHSHTIANVTGLQTALDAKAAAVHTHLPGDIGQDGATNGQVLTWSGSSWGPATPGEGSASLSSGQAFLATDVAMASANTWYDGPSLSLAAGTWLILASATVGRTGTTAGSYNIRISTGTTHYASVQQYHASVANNWAALSCNAIVTLGATTTIKLQAAGTVASDVLKAATPNSASGNNATGLVAVKIA
ncbi:Phage tail repeat like [uncultured Caudovirales phage]|uniref:Phage tail repeat like n=1 Tax=uncultured Caudovirales phage TaxID=2100421 RepID=A0A6J5M4X6_9CAUD|nr:Phage tail repeat like [uncultured Caudovirales phage]